MRAPQGPQFHKKPTLFCMRSASVQRNGERVAAGAARSKSSMLETPEGWRSTGLDSRTGVCATFLK